MPTRKTARSSAMVAVALALPMGAVSAAQARINGEFSVRLGDSVQAAFFSMLTGVTCLLVMLPFLPTARRSLARVIPMLRSGEIKWWQLSGGVFGGTFLAVQAFAVPHLGVALFMIIGVSAQSMGSLVVDRFGIGTSIVRRITPARALGVVLSIGAVTIALLDKLDQAMFPIVAIAVVFLARAGVALQGGINASLAAGLRSNPAAAMCNFVGNFTLLTIVYGVWVATSDAELTIRAVPPWLFLGGVCGLFIVLAANFVIPRVGTLMYGLCVIAGQVVGGIALDAFSPIQATSTTWATILGGGLTLVAAAIGADVIRRR